MNSRFFNGFCLDLKDDLLIEKVERNMSGDIMMRNMIKSIKENEESERNKMII